MLEVMITTPAGATLAAMTGRLYSNVLLALSMDHRYLILWS